MPKRIGSGDRTGRARDILAEKCRRDLDWHRIATLEADVWDFGPQVAQLQAKLADLEGGRAIPFYAFELPEQIRPMPGGLWILDGDVMRPATREHIDGELRRL